MKQIILATALAISLVTGAAIAETASQSAENVPTQQRGWGMYHSDMMGQGWHMRGQGRRGYGMRGISGQCLNGQGMYGSGLSDSASIEKQDAFLQATKELRKKIHDKKFEYMEASRNTKETVGSLREKEEALNTLQQELLQKRQEMLTVK